MSNWRNKQSRELDVAEQEDNEVVVKPGSYQDKDTGVLLTAFSAE